MWRIAQLRANLRLLLLISITSVFITIVRGQGIKCFVLHNELVSDLSAATARKRLPRNLFGAFPCRAFDHARGVVSRMRAN